MHVAIQDAMGWEDYHLHQFEFGDPRKRAEAVIGLPDNDSPIGFRQESLLDWQEYIANWFTPEKPKARYWYDFGDDWWHEIILEKISPAEANTAYPRYVAGKRACPPEDCGGPWGYLDLLNTLKNPGSERYDELKEWVGTDFDPEEFDSRKVVFEDPESRLKDLQDHID